MISFKRLEAFENMEVKIHKLALVIVMNPMLFHPAGL